MSSVPWPFLKLPSIPEYDFAGTVADANGHSEWAAGQGTLFVLGQDGDRVDCLHCAEVLGYLEPFAALRTGQGSLAEYLKISVSCHSRPLRLDQH
jgi:NADPH:quinone reductase-like Zn-dependent oxidoreductase